MGFAAGIKGSIFKIDNENDYYYYNEKQNCSRRLVTNQWQLVISKPLDPVIA